MTPINRRNKKIIPPVDSWKPRTWYVVEVSGRPGNPIHQSLLFTGWSPNDPNGRLGTIVNETYDELGNTANMFIYIKAIREINISIDNQSLSVNDEKLNMIPNK
jgi:hypothetical protein